MMSHLESVDNHVTSANGRNRDAVQGTRDAVWSFQTRNEQRRNAPDSSVSGGLMPDGVPAALSGLPRERPLAALSALHSSPSGEQRISPNDCQQTLATFKKYQAGFSLIELAIVLLVIGLLLGGLIPTISSQIEQQRANETRKQLEEIKQALTGFVIAYGRLPCADTNADGNEDTPCIVAVTTEGQLPWKTLGVVEQDAWQQVWRYRVDQNFSKAFTLTTGFFDNLIVQNNTGTALTSIVERPVAIIYSPGKNLVADGQNTSYNGTYQSDVPSPTFDDIVTWLSRPVLFNRMVKAGRLP
ncbi:MAG: prepilin-type N-terminal cleavage/methylation domain-containing protein [Candidatus Nitrotoga sp.]